MKTITKFQASDGREFTTEFDCINYEVRITNANEILSLIPPLPKLPDCSFENGAGYLQHDPITFTEFKLAILRAIRPYFPEGNFKKWVDDTISGKAHASWVGRLLDEDDRLRPYKDLWSRVYCTDSNFREWGQPYYALNPDTGTQKQLN